MQYEVADEIEREELGSDLTGSLRALSDQPGPHSCSTLLTAGAPGAPGPTRLMHLQHQGQHHQHLQPDRE